MKNNTKIKRLQFAQNVINQFTDTDIEEINESLYDAERMITCVDAIHPGDDEEIKYTWYIPADVSSYDIPSYIKSVLHIEKGDVLVVEQSFGIGLAFVIAASEPYFMSESDHIENVHPYCKVIHNLGEIDIYTE